MNMIINHRLDKKIIFSNYIYLAVSFFGGTKNFIVYIYFVCKIKKYTSYFYKILMCYLISFSVEKENRKATNDY